MTSDNQTAAKDRGSHAVNAGSRGRRSKFKAAASCAWLASAACWFWSAEAHGATVGRFAPNMFAALVTAAAGFLQYVKKFFYAR